jgi:hypothetical protein
MDIAAFEPVAVIVAGSVGFAVGGLWYAPFAFGQVWLRYTTVKPEDLQADVALLPTLFALGGVVVQAAVLQLVLAASGATGIGAALGIAALLWLGFTAAPSLVDALESRRPLVGWMVDAGHRLIAALAMGAVLALWGAYAG